MPRRHATGSPRGRAGHGATPASAPTPARAASSTKASDDEEAGDDDGPAARRDGLARAVVRTLARRTVWTAAFLASWGLLTTLGPAPQTALTPSPPSVPDRVAVLIERNSCWTGPAPATAPEPSRAVVTLPDRRARLVPARLGYEIWLEGRPGILHAFCP